MPLTVITTFLGSVVMMGSWVFIGKRIKNSQSHIPRQIRLLHDFFLHMGIFFTFMAAPHLLLTSGYAEKFPLYMAIGYVTGHIFLYLALINIARMTFSIIPRLASKERWALPIGIGATVLITVINIATMIFGKQPAYDFERNLTLFNAAPVVGAAIGIFAAVAVLPAAILFIVNGFRDPGRRVRSWLLGSGLFLLMTAGPLHDTARTWQLYMVADIVSIISIALVGAGVLYRLGQSLTVSQSE